MPASSKVVGKTCQLSGQTPMLRYAPQSGHWTPDRNTSNRLAFSYYYDKQHTSVNITTNEDPDLTKARSFHQTLQLLTSSEKSNIETETRHAEIAATDSNNHVAYTGCHLTLQLRIGLAGKERRPNSYLRAATAQSCWTPLRNARSLRSLSRHSSGPSRERQSRNG